MAQGQTLTVVVGGGATQTITFGTNAGAGQVETLAQLQTAVAGLSGVTGTVDTANGDISLVATSPTASIAVGGTASAAKFGIENLTALPANGTVIGNDTTTFNDQSVDGGSITAYDADRQSGQRAVPLGPSQQFRQRQHVAIVLSDQLVCDRHHAAWQNVGTTFKFNSNGEMSPQITSLTMPGLTVNGDSLGNVQLQIRQ